MGLHATREDELDRLLRGKVLVDLYEVVRQALRVSQPSYSIKSIEAFYMKERDTKVTEGGDSIISFERFLDTGDRALLAGHRALQRGRLPLDPPAARTGCSTVAPRRSGRSAGRSFGSRNLSLRNQTLMLSFNSTSCKPHFSTASPRTLPITTTTSTRSGLQRNCSTTTGARQSPPGGRTSNGSKPTISS